MDPYRTQKQSRQPLLLTALGTFAALFLFWAVFLRPTAVPVTNTVTKAVAVLKPDGNNFKAGGTVTFTQSAPTAPVKITGQLTGLDPAAQRGFHIHALGDLSGGCVSAGPHFNPAGTTHGARSAKVRHAGDLGNAESDEDGTVTLDFEDAGFSLNGEYGVVGRAVVLHAGKDDLGQGGNEESLKTGNAGARAACGVIGLVN